MIDVLAPVRFAHRFAYDERDSEQVRSEKVAIFLVATCCCVAGVVWSATYFLLLGWGLVAALPLSFTTVVGTALLVSHWSRAHRIAVCAQLLAIMYVTALLEWSIGGMFDSGFVLAWSFLGPVGALFFFPFRRAAVWFALFLINLLITVAFDGYFASHGNPIPAAAKGLFFLMNIAGSATIVFVFGAYFVHAAEQQRRRADDLLLNTLPSSIIPVLKSGQRTIAEHYDSATVLFADIVGSTPLFADLSPSDVVEWLNEAFCAFDEIIARHGVEKVRTIGDSYMVASGVPVRKPDHAKVMARVALEMSEAVGALSQRNGRRLAFRFGINSGPLVAGVIGAAKFQYDLWGDSVNMAARMESHGLPGRIHISDATYRLVMDEFDCEGRNPVDIKGKGSTATWLLIGPKRGPVSYGAVGTAIELPETATLG